MCEASTKHTTSCCSTDSKCLHYCCHLLTLNKLWLMQDIPYISLLVWKCTYKIAASTRGSGNIYGPPGPPKSTSQTASLSVHLLQHSSRLWPRDKIGGGSDWKWAGQTSSQSSETMSEAKTVLQVGGKSPWANVKFSVNLCWRTVNKSTRIVCTDPRHTTPFHMPVEVKTLQWRNM